MKNPTRLQQMMTLRMSQNEQNEDEHNDDDGDEVAQAVPANSRSNARYGLRQKPCPKQLILHLRTSSQRQGVM